MLLILTQDLPLGPRAAWGRVGAVAHLAVVAKTQNTESSTLQHSPQHHSTTHTPYAQVEQVRLATNVQHPTFSAPHSHTVVMRDDVIELLPVALPRAYYMLYVRHA